MRNSYSLDAIDGADLVALERLTDCCFRCLLLRLDCFDCSLGFVELNDQRFHAGIEAGGGREGLAAMDNPVTDQGNQRPPGLQQLRQPQQLTATCQPSPQCQ